MCRLSKSRGADGANVQATKNDNSAPKNVTAATKLLDVWAGGRAVYPLPNTSEKKKVREYLSPLLLSYVPKEDGSDHPCSTDCTPYSNFSVMQRHLG